MSQPAKRMFEKDEKCGGEGRMERLKVTEKTEKKQGGALRKEVKER